MTPEPTVTVRTIEFPRTLSRSETELVEKEFVKDSPISRVLKALAEKGAQSQYDMRRLLPHGTLHDVMEELEGRRIVKLMREEKNSKKVSKKIYGLDFPYGFFAAIAYVQQEDLDMKAVQESNSTLIQALEEEDRETVSELARIWSSGDREALISYCQFIFTRDPGDERIWAVLKAEDPPPSELDTSPKGTTYSSVLVKTDIACRLDKAVLPWKDRRQSRHPAS